MKATIFIVAFLNGASQLYFTELLVLIDGLLSTFGRDF